MALKKNIEHYLDSGNLDLSMLEIQEVPVNKIATLNKVSSLDLSCNIIVSLPKSFASSLTRLVKLDLGKNGITSLPDNFGLLVNLKHLDLYSNKLESLPLSFANLKSLRWLDVKKNPLMPKLAEIAGMCQDDKQCHDAARNVVAAYRSMQDQVDAELARRKEEKIKKLEKSEEEAKAKNNENHQPKKKKKKKKLSEEKTNLPQSNGKIHPGNDVDKVIPKDTSENLATVPMKKSAQSHSFLNKVGRVLSTLVKFIVMSTLLVLFCGFILSLFDEDLYNSLQKKGSVLVRSNVPKQYLKHWDNGLLKSRKVLVSWSENAVASSIVWYNKAHDYVVALSSDEVVQQYLESIKSGWHILWIYLSDTYFTVSEYFGALSKSDSGLPADIS